MTFHLHCEVHPPSHVYCAPVTCLAKSEHKYVAIPPMSYGTLNWPDGCFSETNFLVACSLVIFSLFSMISICFWINGVNTHPGHMTLHVIPEPAVSKATALVNPTSPCLAATYADLLTEATNPCTLAILMILPHPLCFI